ncbi:MAG: protein kinase [bacterium]|nr:protein kinase [bacterium]
MRADDDRLAGLLGSVSDGEVIDWDAVVRRMGPAELPVIEALRDVDRIHSFNRGLQRAGASGDPLPDSPGDVPRWGDLLLLERCGVGAQAEVYRAWDPGLRREVALKLLRAGAPGADAGADRSPLLAEGRALARIRHPHVVAVHGIDEHDGRVGLWMELVRGETLEEHVQAHGMLTPGEAARLGCEIGSALAAVHAAGLLHRDIKPANIVRDADGRFVLTDFGLGLARREAPAATMAIAGSPMYMAPELLFGSAPDARADIYALGMLVWYALTGRHPFPAGTLESLRVAAANGPSPSLAECRPGLPAALLAAVASATAPAASQRPGQATAFVEALATAAIGAAAPASAGRRAAWRVMVVGAAAIVAVAAIVVVAGRDRAPGPLTPDAAWSVEATLMRDGEGAPTPLLNDDVVAPGDRLLLRWRASRPVWVYVLNADDQGEAYLLFPQPRFDLRNPLPADSTLVLPGPMAGREVAWTVTSAGGRETFLVVAGPEPVPELEPGASGLAAPDPGRAVAYTGVQAGVIERLRGVGGLAEAAAPRPATDGGAALGRFRALAGRESGVTGLWVREIVLRNPR